MLIFCIEVLLVIMFAEVAAVTLATSHIYCVHPEDKLCVDPPCLTLQNITNHTHVCIKSNTTFIFGEGIHHYRFNNVIIKDFENISLIGTSSNTSCTLRKSTINCWLFHVFFSSK